MTDYFFIDYSKEILPTRNHQRDHYREKSFVGKIEKLDIPYNFIVQVMNDSEQWRYPKNQNYLKGFSELLRRIYELIELNQSDNYHWKNLQGSVIPIEPVSLALIMLFLKRWLQHHSFQTLIKNIEADERQRILLQLAFDLLEAG